MEAAARLDAPVSPADPAAWEARACRWARVSWADLARLCRLLADRVQKEARPEAVVALARAGYVPGAILSCLLRCDLVTVRVPSAGDRGRFATELTASSLRPVLGGRRVLIIDETTVTGESLAWATRVAAGAGAASVRTAVLFLTAAGPQADFWAEITDAHVLQPWSWMYLEDQTPT